MGTVVSRKNCRQTLVTDDVRQYKKYQITPASLGQVMISRCGNEGTWRSNTPEQKRDREFLQKGISFIPEAIKHGADLKNAAFIFCYPGRDFAVISGNHAWEFTFFEENGGTQAQCTRGTIKRWPGDVVAECWGQRVDYARNFAYQALTGRPYVSEAAITAGVRCPKCGEVNSSSGRYCNSCGCLLH